LFYLGEVALATIVTIGLGPAAWLASPTIGLLLFAGAAIHVAETMRWIKLARQAHSRKRACDEEKAVLTSLSGETAN